MKFLLTSILATVVLWTMVNILHKHEVRIEALELRVLTLELEK